MLVLPNSFEISKERFNSKRSFFCRDIANGRTFQESNGRKVMELKLYNATQVSETPHLQILVSLPSRWTQRMYLAALYHTIRNQHAIVIHTQGNLSDLNGIDQLSEVECETVLSTLHMDGILYLL